ncbi:alcohol dehydrogenase, zinc-containing [Purpureocillium lilacinum]|uniref:Alcohol dehydrogenase, zinc-containing n=1 Tax=Purpureocillium lilacinum TaxID=33203 RepID=A0A179HFX8_PURLI|nr:alcohol dehydrogenase, zinc-containing [Purpureocillium lilacinum]OAQ88914.1 alcohol dehydrogenase, zinc-containing [Purpureocillium lilacinum]
MASSLWQTVTNFGRPQAQKQPEQHASVNNVKMDPPPKKMKAWMTALNGLDKLQQSEVDVPEPRDGEVLVRIEAVSLNYRDTEVVKGEYNHMPSLLSPGEAIVPCSDMAGTVVTSRGDAASHLPPGTRVISIFLQDDLSAPLREEALATGLGYPLPGVLCHYRVFPARTLVRCPAYLSAAEAATLPIAAVTAWTSLNWMRPLGSHVGTDPPDVIAKRTALMQGTGGVAIAGLQIAHAAGLKTIITSSSDDKLKRARDELGADTGINYRTYWQWQEPVMKATGGRGVDVIFETGGTRTIRKSFESIAFGGVINCIGYLSGKHEDGDDEGDGDKTPQLHRLNVNVMALRRNVTLRGIINGPKDRFEEMLGFYEEKKIKPVVDKVFDFDDVKDAFDYLVKGKHFGKVVIKVSE